MTTAFAPAPKGERMVHTDEELERFIQHVAIALTESGAIDRFCTRIENLLKKADGIRR